MAGIMESQELVTKGQDSGICVAKGITTTNEKYIIVMCDSDDYITVFDYSSDVQIEESIEPGDYVRLKLLDEFTALWQVDD